MPGSDSPRWVPGDRFYRALTFAIGLHATDSRKNAQRDPYLVHLLTVAALVVEDGGAENDAIAGLLHDAVEDHGRRARLEQIRSDFGMEVARIVEGCSDRVDDDPDWPYRKARYIQHLRVAPPDVRRVSLADKLHNARSTVADIASGAAFNADFNSEPGHQSWYYAELLASFEAARTVSRHLAEFRRLVEQITRTWPVVVPPELVSARRLTAGT